jgi:hypothetical protein
MMLTMQYHQLSAMISAGVIHGTIAEEKSLAGSMNDQVTKNGRVFASIPS